MSTNFWKKKVCWQCPAMFCLYTFKQSFPPMIWIFTEGEGDGVKSRLPSKKFSTQLIVCLLIYLLFYHVISNYFRWTGSSLQPFLRLSGTRWHIWSFDHASKNSWKEVWGHPGSDRGQIKNTLASRGNKGSDWQVIYLWKLHLLKPNCFKKQCSLSSFLLT